jgi:hypothetical protein
MLSGKNLNQSGNNINSKVVRAIVFGRVVHPTSAATTIRVRDGTE